MREWLLNPERVVILDIVKTLIFLGVLVIVRAIVGRMIGRVTDLSVEDRRRWMHSLRNVLFFVFVFGLVFIWAHELSTFAVSLVAVAVAMVLATKELIMCLTGALLRMRANAYAPGDRIEVANLRGKVLDQNFLSTRLLEIGPGRTSNQYTGRTVIFPNSLLLTGPVVNETNVKDYTFHTMTFPLSAVDDWTAAERLLLEVARDECAPYLDEARRSIKKLEGTEWLDAPTVDPRINIQIPEPGRIHLLLRFAVPSSKIVRIEQVILRRFLSDFPPGRPAGVSAVPIPHR
jgi:small-conductance mechanosensitive channel